MPAAWRRRAFRVAGELYVRKLTPLFNIMHSYISQVKITNFKKYKSVDIKLHKYLNIITGDNDSGKSTILEAIDLALSGLYKGKLARNEISQSFFNSDCVYEYLEKSKKGEFQPPPEITIEVFFADDNFPIFQGDNNSLKESKSGFIFQIKLDNSNRDLFNEWFTEGSFGSLPVELYKTEITAFSRDSEIYNHRHIPIKSSFIDATRSKGGGTVDLYLSKILRDDLTDREIIQISKAFRKSITTFAKDPFVVAVGEKISHSSKIPHKSINISVDMPSKNSWDNNLTTFVNEIPFHSIGKGEQSIIKTMISISSNKDRVLLIEEPENHLSHASLNKLLNEIKTASTSQQVIISTHSSFVANKLGIKSIILLANNTTLKLEDLSQDTQEYFEKMPGYDTLRAILCKKAILVEGSSDELIIQRAYMDNNNGNLPIHHGIDVISVGIAFERFLELGAQLNLIMRVVTDSDGDIDFLKSKYSKWLSQYVVICYDDIIDSGDLYIGKKKYNYNTLEPKIIKANSLKTLNEIFETNYTSEDDLRKFMHNNKANCALKIFKSAKNINFPQYIMDAIK